MSKFELSDNDILIIQGMCDISLKAGGLKNYSDITRILNVMQRPVTEKDVKDENKDNNKK